MDAIVVPALLLLVARDLAAFDPPRVLAWRLLHDPRLSELPGGLSAWLSSMPEGLDRDPIALALSGLATLLAALVLWLGLRGASLRSRAAALGVSALLLVVLPSSGFIAMGRLTDRPYGQDGGVVQLPLALDKLLSGDSPYAADYSGSVLGRQSRASSFWGPLGGNPILRHHAYLPGTHAVMLPFHLASKGLFGFFDPRVVTLLAWAGCGLLVFRLAGGGSPGLAAAAAVLLNPLVYWQQIFGANDLLFVAFLLLAARAGESSSLLQAGGWLGLACATKQLAWPFAPFLLLHWSAARHDGSGGIRGDVRALLGRETLVRCLRPLAAAVVVALIVALPVISLDPGAFYADVIAYNVGFGGDLYPFGGTPGFGFANFVIDRGLIADLRQAYPLGRFYVLLVPLGLLMARAQLRRPELSTALLNGSAALASSLYFSRVVHANYLMALAAVLPLAILLRRRDPDLAVGPLLLLLTAVETSENSTFKLAWEQARDGKLVEWMYAPFASLAPRSELSLDPMGAVVSALAAGLGVLWLASGAAGARPRARFGIGLAAVLCSVLAPSLLVTRLGEATGVRREESGWSVQASSGGQRLRQGRSPWSEPGEPRPEARELASSSFRLEPPARFAPDIPKLTPGAAVLGALAGRSDPRRLLWLAMLAVAALAWTVPSESGSSGRALLLAVAALAPPVSFGVIWGSGAIAAIALVLAGAEATRRGQVAGGALLGAAVALEPALLWGAPLLALAPSQKRGRVSLAALATLALLSVPALLDPAATGRAVQRALILAPSAGLAGLWLSRDWPAELFPLVSLGGLALAAALAWRSRLVAPTPSAAFGVLCAVALLPGVAPSLMALPLALLALVATQALGDDSGTPAQLAEMPALTHEAGLTEGSGGSNGAAGVAGL